MWRGRWLRECWRSRTANSPPIQPPPAQPKASPQSASWQFSAPGGRSFARRGLLSNRPDVPVVNRVAVILQLDRAAAGGHGVEAAGGGRAIDFGLVVNEHPIVLHGQHGVFDLLAGFVEFGGGEIHIVSLPDQRRETHVHRRFVFGVNAAALVVLALESEAVE